ncbi:hypothetical protein LOC67_27125 [Stieleria sp. JC731]|uniref:hypothetical protein n=1 Tax=Stieleria sp. JC731 TaxID=2894195 RepID=UPI001E62F6C7|nr:hypothetical protein [Stieleria sp. JC731]MCC9602231.1 hypothetical protein [Stieleria sp. JC731]MCC9604243.1 hypothetical protein [Stieleria sp. JC731]
MHAIGSAYLIRQAAGAERYDGATVEISRAFESNGAIVVDLIERNTGNQIDGDASFLEEYARIAIDRFARDYVIDLRQWNVRVDQFAYHPIDSGPKGIHDAVYNAVSTAFAQWASMTVQVPIEKAEPDDARESPS